MPSSLNRFLPFSNFSSILFASLRNFPVSSKSSSPLSSSSSSSSPSSLSSELSSFSSSSSSSSSNAKSSSRSSPPALAVERGSPPSPSSFSNLRALCLLNAYPPNGASSSSPFLVSSFSSSSERSPRMRFTLARSASSSCRFCLASICSDVFAISAACARASKANDFVILS